MNLLIRNFALVLFASIVLLSCKDDDKKIDKFSLGDDTYKITTAFFVKDIEPGTDTDGDEYYRNQLTFTNGITVTSVGGAIIPSGEGHYVTLLINNVGRELQPGTYTWQAEENEQPFDLWAAYVSIDYRKENQADYDLISGTLIVTKSGDTYKVKFEGVALLEAIEGELVPGSDVNVTIEFEGSLAEFEVEF